MHNAALQGVDPVRLTEVAQHAESLGFESFYVPEHISLYVGAAIGDMQIPPDVPIADPLAAVGVSSLPGAAAAVGVDFRTRGRRADEAIDAMRLLWASGADGVDFEGEFFTLEQTTSFPKPFAGTTLPIHVGGASNAAARRAGLRGDGCFSGGVLADAERQAQSRLMRDTAISAGRDPEQLQVSRWGSLDIAPEGVESYEQQGVSRLVSSLPGGSLDELLHNLGDFASRHHLRAPM